MTDSAHPAYTLRMDLTQLARGATPITLDRPRLLLFDSAALWLLMQKYGQNTYLQALYSAPPAKKGAPVSLVLNSMDVLVFYLWVGLQAESNAQGDKLALDQVRTFITPRTFGDIFQAVISALMRDLSNPEPAGKAEAAAARPAAVAKKRPAGKASTSSRKSASRSARSAGRPNSSGARR